MIIWRGFGILVAIVGIISIVVLDKLTLAFAKDWYEAHKRMSEFFTFLLTAVALYGLAWLLKKNDRPRIVIDKESGKEIHLRRGDSLFFIPVGAWPFIVLLFAFYKLLFTGA
jgi:hypothetical protein